MTRENTVNVTQAMLRAGASHIGGGSTFSSDDRMAIARAVFEAMLSAAPLHEGEGEDWSELVERLGRRAIGGSWVKLSYEEADHILKLIASARSAHEGEGEPVAWRYTTSDMKGWVQDTLDRYAKEFEGVRFRYEVTNRLVEIFERTVRETDVAAPPPSVEKLPFNPFGTGLSEPRVSREHMRAVAASVEVERLREALEQLCENAELARFHIGNTDGGDIIASALWDTIGQARAALSKQEPGVPTPGGQGE